MIKGLFKSAKVVDKSLEIIEKLIPDKDKRQEAASSLIDSEMRSGDSLTKKARPAIIYTGLFLIISEIFCVRLLILQLMDADSFMVENSTQMLKFFMATWGGVVSIYIGGRSYEKVKMRFLKK